jgi:hypothetical protein
MGGAAGAQQRRRRSRHPKAVAAPAKAALPAAGRPSSLSGARPRAGCQRSSDVLRSIPCQSAATNRQAASDGRCDRALSCPKALAHDGDRAPSLGADHHPIWSGARRQSRCQLSSDVLRSTRCQSAATDRQAASDGPVRPRAQLPEDVGARTVVGLRRWGPTTSLGADRAGGIHGQRTRVPVCHAPRREAVLRRLARSLIVCRERQARLTRRQQARSTTGNRRRATYAGGRAGTVTGPSGRRSGWVPTRRLRPVTSTRIRSPVTHTSVVDEGSMSTRRHRSAPSAIREVSSQTSRECPYR